MAPPGPVGTVAPVPSAPTLFERHRPAPDPLVAVGPGQVVETDDGPWGLATAVFDTTRAYRYQLSRVWDPAGPRLNFLMLNPSTADAFQLDPTVRRCVGFAQAWSFGSLVVTNCYALRSTDPDGLRAVADPVGPDNDPAILAAARSSDLVVAAWGVHASLGGRGAAVRRLLGDAGVELHYLRLTKGGHPGHPLYLHAATPATPWR